MSLTRKQVRARLNSAARSAGYEWATLPNPDFDWESASGEVLAMETFRIHNLISETHPDWAEMLAYNTPAMVVRELGAWDARKWRNIELVKAHNLRNDSKLDAARLRETLLNKLRRSNLLNSRGALEYEELQMLRSALSLQISKEWIAHGGYAPSKSATLFSLLCIETLVMYADPLSTVLPNEDGIPSQVTNNVLAAVAESMHDEELREYVAGRLPTSVTSWADFDADSTISEFVLSAVAMLHDLPVIEAASTEEQVDIAEWQLMHPKPPATPYGINPQGAELWVRDWMLWMGASGAETTQYVQDGGLDVVADYVAAQVKLYTGSVSVNEVRELVGAMSVNPSPKLACFFNSGTYTQSALEFAEQSGVAMLHFDATTGEVEGANELGSMIALHGFWDTARALSAND